MRKDDFGLQKLADFMANAFFNYKEGPVIYLNLALNNAEALLRAHEFMAYYNMKWFSGVDLVDNDNPIINEGNHFDEMKPWLEDHPDLAPIRLDSLIITDEQ